MGRDQTADRLLDNPVVDWREILDIHTQQTVMRMHDQPVVLCIQDATELDFTLQPGMVGLGRLSDETQHGMSMHPTLAVTPAGTALRVLDAWMWARKPKNEFDVKESARWVEGYEILADLAETIPETRLVYADDWEGNFLALMDAAAQHGHPADWRVRAQHNRHLPDGKKL